MPAESSSHYDQPITLLGPQGCEACEAQFGTSSKVWTSGLKSTVQVYVTAYSITSVFSRNSICVTARGDPTVLSTPFVVTSPASIAPSDFQTSIEEGFADFLGFSACSSPSTSSPSTLPKTVILNATQSSSVAASPPSAISNPPDATTIPVALPARSGLTAPQKAGVGVGVSCGSILFLLLGLILWRELNKRRRINGLRNTAGLDVPNDESKFPYLQAKAELEDESNRRRRYELEARSRASELGGGGRVELGGGGKVELGGGDKVELDAENACVEVEERARGASNF